MLFDKTFLRSRGLIWNGNHLPYNPTLKENARRLRKSMTQTEKKLWFTYLRGCSTKVLRQQPIDNYIVDFYVPKIKLVIELDGEYHLQEEQKRLDEMRRLFLEHYGITVIRFSNLDMQYRFDEVCQYLETLFI